MRLSGGGRARVLVAPYAWKDPKEAYNFAKGLFRGLGARNVSLLPLDRSAVSMVEEADAIWFSGGFQKRQVLALGRVGGLTRALQAAHKRGTVMIGGSAGAAVMSRLMISGGSNGTAYTRAGLGFLNRVVLDQHVIARSREWRLRQVISNNRGHLGVGIDERMGILVEGGQFKVYGRSKVIVSQWSNGKLTELVLRRGDRFDFASR